FSCWVKDFSSLLTLRSVRMIKKSKTNQMIKVTHKTIKIRSFDANACIIKPDCPACRLASHLSEYWAIAEEVSAADCINAIIFIINLNIQSDLLPSCSEYRYWRTKWPNL